MARAVSQWSWKLFRLAYLGDTSNPDNLPLLPSSRRPITPPSSKPTANFILPNGYFFERLPLELRQNILIDLFGNRPVHFDLEFARPRPPGQKLRHGDYFLDDTDPAPVLSTPFPGTQGNEPEVWQWRSCICHRSPPPGDKTGLINGLWMDQCLDGRAFSCHLWPGEAPGKCHIDVMNWLLTCRQAYLEGINILYSTNTFVVDTRILVLNFSKLLLPQSLALVTSLELQWEVDKPPTYHSDNRNEWPDPVDLPFKLIKKTFPRLRTLHVSLHGDMLSTGEAEIEDPEAKGSIEIREKVIFDEVEQFMQGSNISTLFLALNWTLWTQLKRKASTQPGFCFEELGYPGARFWRSFGPDAKEPGEAGQGCWVVEGRHGW